jgi:glycosyltransferase involved in cell wall biosynthesis
MSADSPLVTALINSYNYARYLPFAINSVLNQTYPNIEIIVVDDGSTDHTEELQAHYEGKVRWVRTVNGGQGHAFNIGIPLANGELTMLLDADDMWVPEKVERMVAMARRNPQAALLYHRFQNIDKYGKEAGPPQPFPLINGDYRDRYLRSGGTWWSPITSVLVLRTEHIKKAVPIPTYAVREGADTILTDYCAVTSEIAANPEALTLRLLHGSNLYAAGRDNFLFRSKEIREADVRRIEWRMYAMRQLMDRLGIEFDIDIDRNEWRATNLYWLGRTSFWKMLRACMLSPEHSMKFRVERLKWIIAGKRMYRNG